MVVSHGSNNQVYNNIIYDNGCGVQVSGNCNNCLVYNNTIYNNSKTFGISVISGSGVIVKNNIVYGSGTNNIEDYTGTGTFSNNLCTKIGPGCALAGNPLFVNAGAHDFHLQSTSPAIDAGVTLSAVPTDMSGMPRPYGARYDIGAYEYQVSTVPAPLPTPKNLRATSVGP
jgi:parallel beta-helix repeat protein